MANGKQAERGVAVHEGRRPGAVAWPEDIDRLLGGCSVPATLAEILAGREPGLAARPVASA
jgi:hypothetical protein